MKTNQMFRNMIYTMLTAMVIILFAAGAVQSWLGF